VATPLPASTQHATIEDGAGHTDQASAPTTVARGPTRRITNQGAYASWQFGSGTFTATSGPLVSGWSTILPMITKLN
jgi:hypothetical protein